MTAPSLRTTAPAWSLHATIALLILMPMGALALLGLWYAEADQAASAQARREAEAAILQESARQALQAIDSEAERLSARAARSFAEGGALALRRFYLTEPIIGFPVLHDVEGRRLFPQEDEALLFGEDRLMRRAEPRLAALREAATPEDSAWSGDPREPEAPAISCRRMALGEVCLLLRMAPLQALAAEAAAPARLLDPETSSAPSQGMERVLTPAPAPFTGLALAAEFRPAPSRSSPSLALLLAPTLLGSALAAGFALRAHRLRLRAAEMKTAALAEISHDLRTPLANLRLYADLLRGASGKPEKLARYASVIEEETARLSRIVEGALTALGGGDASAEALETVSPDRLVSSLLERYGPSFGAALTPILDLQAPEPARIDARAFERVLLNLLDNARKHAPGAELRLVTRREGGRVSLVVSDHGARQAPQGVGGFGVGLNSCAALARAAGGDFIWSLSPQGGRFALSLPDHLAEVAP